MRKAGGRTFFALAPAYVLCMGVIMHKNQEERLKNITIDREYFG